MNETEQNNSENLATENTAPPTEPTTEPQADAPKKSMVGVYVGAIILVILIVLGALYLLEKEGRSPTNLFDSVTANQEANSVVAVVNGEEIVSSELDTSIQQFEQMASAQGVDTSSESFQADARDQALEVLINTELLKQSARERGMTVSEEQISERIEGVKNELGGEEALSSRMNELGISEEKLREDIKDELLIQTLLDQIFDSEDVDITEEEVVSTYEEAGGEEAGLPPLAEVRGQVEAQIMSGKEQEAVDAYIQDLKGDAEIEIVD